MEILAERAELFEYYVLIGFLALVALVAFIGLISTVVYWRSYSVSTNVVLTILTLVMIALPIFGITAIIQKGPDVYYDAIVTDWNEVYGAGYRVESIDGKIVTLTKD